MKLMFQGPSVPIIRDLICPRSLMMGTEMVLETSVSYRHLMQLIAQEDFIEPDSEV
jgi:hypothetical protein